MLMDPGQLISEAFKTFQARGRDMVIAVLVVLVPVEVIRFLWLVATDDSVGGILGQLVVALLAWIGSLLATAACYRIVSEYGEGRIVGWRESIESITGRLGDVIVASLLVGIAVVVGFALCIAPGIWLAVLFAFTIPVLLSEGVGAVDAIRRSADLVKGRWWAIFGRLILVMLLAVVAVILFSIVVAIPLVVILGSDGVGGQLANSISNLIGSVVFTPLFAAVVTILYFQLRGAGPVTPTPPAGFPQAPQAPQPVTPGDAAPPASVGPPGSGWGAPTPAAPQPPADPQPPAPAEPLAPPPVSPAAPTPPPVPPADAGSSASTGSLWSAGDPLQQPPPPSEPQWEPPAPQPPDPSDEPPPSAPPPA